MPPKPPSLLMEPECMSTQFSERLNRRSRMSLAGIQRFSGMWIPAGSTRV